MPAAESITGRLIVVDAEAAQMQALCDLLRLEGFDVKGFTAASEALSSIQEAECDVLLADLMTPETDGVALLSQAAAISPDVVVIAITGSAPPAGPVKAMQAGALDYVAKPFDLAIVLPVIHRALAMRQLRADNRRLEIIVGERTRELESANRHLDALKRDLESFSYSVSHDLRAPLRAVEGFCQMYLEDFGATVPAEGLRLLNHVTGGAKRMGQIIEDLLALSRVGRQELRKREISLNALADGLIASLRAAEPDREIQIEVRDLGSCYCDPSLIEQVLANLLSNAFKFTRRRDPAVVELGCAPSAEGTIYFVRDNGAGFDMKYIGKLFGIFQRLHAATDFEGTGVGLSIAERIIRRHGGRIWAESSPDKGATFYFTVPADPEGGAFVAGKAPPADAERRAT